MSLRSETWWGVINGQGQLSQVLSTRGMAVSAMQGREDAEECRLVRVELSYDTALPAPTKGKPK